jgi:hypothetical protein
MSRYVHAQCPANVAAMMQTRHTIKSGAGNFFLLAGNDARASHSARVSWRAAMV